MKTGDRIVFLDNGDNQYSCSTLIGKTGQLGKPKMGGFIIKFDEPNQNPEDWWYSKSRYTKIQGSLPLEDEDEDQE